MRITGIPYRIVDHLNEGHNVRSFLHDPMRAEDAERYQAGFQPTVDMIATMNDVLEGNPYWSALTSWAADASVPSARLVLRWPGQTPVVRAFTYQPSVSAPGPRTVYLTRVDDDRPCRVRSDDPRYALLSWPVLFPRGRVLHRRPIGPAAQWPSTVAWAPFEEGPLCEDDSTFALAGRQLSAATLAIAYQPERRRTPGPAAWRDPPSYVLVPTLSPYAADARVLRPFSRVELAGRVGEEFILDRWLCRVDARRWMLNRMQRHLRGRTLSAAERAEFDELEQHEYDAAADEERQVHRSTRMPNTEPGTPQFHRKMAARALYVVHRTTRPVLFITQTLNASCPEIRTRLACFRNADGHEHVQEAYDRPGLHCDVFEGKSLALQAALRSGTIFRNLGRPTLDVNPNHPEGKVTVTSASGRGRVDVDRYIFPLETRGGGHLIGARENQRGGYEHFHYTWAPRKVPSEWTMNVREGGAMPWVDGFTCARVPDRDVLIQFKWLLRASDARALPGVAERTAVATATAAATAADAGAVPAVGERGAEPSRPRLYDAYAYLKDKRDDELVCHPDLVHDGGGALSCPNRLLRRLIELSTGEGQQLAGCTARVDGAPASYADGTVVQVLSPRDPPSEAADAAEADECRQAGYMYYRVRRVHSEDADGSDDDDDDEPKVIARVCLTWTRLGRPPGHYSLAAYSQGRKPKGPMIHQHCRSPTAPMNFCKDKTGACSGFFPKPPKMQTQMGAGGFVDYMRLVCDIMVVAYNPWLLFYCCCHLNCEVVASSASSVLYLFKLIKYISKPHEVNRAQVVGDGDVPAGEQGAPEERTHRRTTPRDQVNHWFEVMETCAPYALRGHHSRNLFIMQPGCEDVRCVAPSPYPTPTIQLDISAACPPPCLPRRCPSSRPSSRPLELAHSPLAVRATATALTPALQCSSSRLSLRRVHAPRDADSFKDAHAQQSCSDWELYLARPRLPELASMPIELFYATWTTRSAPLMPAGQENGARCDRRENYNAKTRTVYVGTDVSVHRTAGATSGAAPVHVVPRYYWRRTPGFDAAAVPPLVAGAAEDVAADDAELGDDEVREGGAADVHADDAEHDDANLVRLSRVPFRKQHEYYLRELAHHRSAYSYEELLTDDRGVQHETAQGVCRALGYLDEFTEGRDVLRAEIDGGVASPVMLRSLFVQIVIAKHAVDDLIGAPGVLAALRDPGWDDDDVLSDLGQRLWALNWDISHVLPLHHQPMYVAGDLESALERLEPQAVWMHRLATHDALQVDAKQAAVVYWALTGVELDASAPAPDLRATRFVAPAAGCEVAVLVGVAGSGKSRVCQRIIAEFGARKLLVMPTAISNLAATAFIYGGTVHALFNLGIESDSEGNRVVQLEADGGTVTADRDVMLYDPRCACLIVDEGLASVSSLIEGVIEFCTRRNYCLRIVINGDPQQLPPVVPYGSPTDVVLASLLSSWVWQKADAHFTLAVQYRNAADPAWARFLKALATATAPALANHPFNSESEHATAVAAPLIRQVYVHRPVRTFGLETAMRAVTDLFGTTADGRLAVRHNGERNAHHILCATNTQCHFWNDVVTQMRERDGAYVHDYVAINTAKLRGGGNEEGTAELAMEALRDEADMFDHADHSVPLSTVRVSEGDLIMLPVCGPSHLPCRARTTTRLVRLPVPPPPPRSIRLWRWPISPLQMTVDKEAGLVKNKVVRITMLRWCRMHVLDEKAGTTHVLCRQHFIFALTRHLNGIEIHRTQLPAQLAWAITVNKAQGKTIERALLDLRKPYWQHGSGFVAPSRVPLARNCLAYVDAASSTMQHGARVPVIRNVVFPGLVVE